MTGVSIWWLGLTGVSALNVAWWLHTRRALLRERAVLGERTWGLRRRQLMLSAVFVLGCAFRSILPRADVQRICLVDSWLSSVLVGRSVATLAELCFMAQWALLLREVAEDVGAPRVAWASRLVVPMIAFAEVCSWGAILTTNYLGNVVEESTWTLTGLLLTVSAVALWAKVGPRMRPVLGLAIALGVCYLAFMTTVDVPMYLSRWQADTQSHHAYLSLADGLRDVATRWRVTFAWEEWRTEMPWMSLYFSVAVWASMAIVRAPRSAIAKREGPTNIGLE